MSRKNGMARTYTASIAMLILLLFPALGKAQVSPFQGLGQVQFFDNSGAPLTSGVLYSFQAGTSTQQATFTDATGLIQNVNPITFGSGARAGIWLTTANFYKFVLCAQNDGAACAAGDILFSVDNVPGGSSGGGGGGCGSTCTSIFISSTASPATSGALRLASGDSICWRNAPGSINLCIKKDSNDLLSWDGGSLKLPEVGAPAGVAAFDILWADSTAHRLKAINNAGSAAQYVLSGNDLGLTDQVLGLHFGSTQELLSGTAPTTGQCLNFNGTNIGGTACIIGEVAIQSPTNINVTGTQNETQSAIPVVFLGSAHTLIRLGAYETLAASGCTGAGQIAFKDVTASSNVTTLNLPTNPGVGVIDSGVISFSLTAGHVFAVIISAAASGCTTFPQLKLWAVYQ